MNTKKDFEATARIIAGERAAALKYAISEPQKGAGALLAIDRIMHLFAVMYAKENARFDAKLFFEACWVDTVAKNLTDEHGKSLAGRFFCICGLELTNWDDGVNGSDYSACECGRTFNVYRGNRNVED